MIGTFQASANLTVKILAIGSVAPPGGYGTTTVIGRFG